MKGAAFVAVYLERQEGRYSFNFPMGTHYNLAHSAIKQMINKIKELKKLKEMYMKGAAFVTLYLEKQEGLYSFNIPWGTHYNLAVEAVNELAAQVKELKELEDKRKEESGESQLVSSEPIPRVQ